METWRPVPDYPRYEASDLGRVRSLIGRFNKVRPEPLVLKAAASGQGNYPAVTLWNDEGYRKRYVHEIVLTTFKGKAPTGHEAAHRDGDQTNNHLRNLSWTTRKVNHSHKVGHGRTLRGERGATVLTEAQVIALRSEYRFGVKGCGTHALGRKYGISQRHARNIVVNKRWAYDGQLAGVQ